MASQVRRCLDPLFRRREGRQVDTLAPRVTKALQADPTRRIIPEAVQAVPTHRVIPAKAGIQLLLVAIMLGKPAAASGIDPETGLVIAPGFDQVKAQCTICHSGRLVAQNRASREGWLKMIRWMQESQGLWPLGDAEATILDYLEAHYGPRPGGRRAPLAVTFDGAAPG